MIKEIDHGITNINVFDIKWALIVTLISKVVVKFFDTERLLNFGCNNEKFCQDVFAAIPVIDTEDQDRDPDLDEA